MRIRSSSTKSGAGEVSGRIVLLQPDRAGPGTARRELVEADDERAAGDVRASLLPGPAGVAAQQPQAVAIARRDRQPAVGADPGGPAVERMPAHRRQRRLMGRDGPRETGGRDRHPGAAPCHRRNGGAAQRPAIHDQRVLRFHLRSATVRSENQKFIIQNGCG